MEKEYRSLLEKHHYGTTVWSPLAQGFLSGKFNDGNIPEDSRAKKWDPFWGNWLVYNFFSGSKKEDLLRICKGIAELSKELGYTQAQLCIAWCLASRDVSTVLFGFSSFEQLDSNIKALELYNKWDKEIEAKVEAVLNNQPEPRVDFR